MRRYRGTIAVLWRWLARGLSGGLALLALAGTPAHADAPNHLATELIAEGPAAPGGVVTLAVHMIPQPGWHGYWRNPGDAGFAMRLVWTLPPGAKVGEPLYPVPRPLLIAGLMNHVYESEYAVLVRLTLPEGAQVGAVLPVRLAADWLVCSATICVPEKAALTTNVRVGAGPGDPRFDLWRQRLPAPLGAPARFVITGGALRLALPLPASVKLAEPHVFLSDDGVADYAGAQAFARDGDTLVITLPRAKFAAKSPAALAGVLALGDGNGLEFAAAPGAVPADGTPLAGNAAPDLAALPLLLLAALAGGLLLNVMPCVFPILSLKALSLARAGGSAAEARAEGFAYSAGVVVACAGLGAALLALRGAGHEVGWAFQLQEPGVVAVLLVLACAITANFAGLYELAVPGFVQNGAGAARGAFATGLLAAFVATPCTGPFMASAMGAALLLPVPAAMALFVALGVGLALPFLVIALVPAARAMLPRPGAWMNWLRRALAVPMALTALALVWLASRLGGWHFAGLAGIFAAIVVVLLANVGAAQRRGLPAARRFVTLSLVLAVTALVILPRSIRPPSAEVDVLPDQPFSEPGLAQARASGHPIFAFFTADWCLTCKVNERASIERADTKEAFARAGVVVLKGDWTRRDPAITRFLTAQGAAGVPLYLWYAPGQPARVLPQILTPAALTDLAKAR